ncbi:diguanylate cyclase [Deinococcus sp. HMF7620]|uniref:Diguanylate cyclase n=1 Tax=Deinococcus arboris TaxID=2682977 RepID=A0A7C9HR59_9DEIO|nr:MULTISPECIES: GGDEF domain-containing protein [Deinococcus]MBZ9751309.1 GGDEF domain-containing protein [Deinococcus betulae]MVN86734.1 diguanylate cyclase [Deinococcus arboris]
MHVPRLPRGPFDPAELSLRERRLFTRLILPGGALALAVPLWLHAQTPYLCIYDQQLLPVMMVALLLLGLLSWTRLPLFWIEIAMVAVLNSFIVSRLGYMLAVPTLHDRAALLSPTLPWTLVTLLLNAWVFPGSLAVRLNFALLCSLVLCMLAWWPAEATSEQPYLISALVQLVLAVLAVLAAQVVVNRHTSLVSRLTRQALQEAHTDALTGLPNRRALLHALDGLTRPMTMVGPRLAAALVDVDHFKRVNDEHGHPRGDEVLRALAVHLRAQQPAGGVVGRYGGEEFLCLLMVPDEAAALEFCERLRSRMTREPLAGLPITVSVGLAVVGAPVHVPTLLDAADEALYQAKHAGRNRVHLAGSVQSRAADLPFLTSS